MLPPPPLPAAQLSRAAPRNITLPSHLQPLAAATWLLNSVRQAPEYQAQQQAHQAQQAHLQQQFSSWKYRDPAVLTQAGLEASVKQVRVRWWCWRLQWLDALSLCSAAALLVAA